MTQRWVATDRELAALVDELRCEPRYALDTEFHRERTYHPRLALVQLAWPGGIALVDPLACDVRRLVPLLQGDGLAVLHAAQQDLDVLHSAIGVIPSRIYDTQLAACFVGYRTPSLAALVLGELRVALPKGDRLTDWLRRPLTDAQRAYAASDVMHLLALHDSLVAQTDRLGRSAWVDEACEELRTRSFGPVDPAEAWLRLKDVRSLAPTGRGIARAVAEWRERRAMASDVPPRQVLSDLAILGIAQRAPRTPQELAEARGVEERHHQGALGREILEAVARGLAQEAHLPVGDTDELDRQLRPAVTLISAWVSELARRERIDTSLLATRADIVALLRGDPDARLTRGWRAEVVGDDVRHLVEGSAALTVDGSGRLRLIPVPPVG